tara:strand:+ start:96 stop:389 length:294 start_codon:yes stop_codon:yes gene_type:complete
MKDIILFRKKYDLKQRELADLTGVSYRSIQRYETVKNRWSIPKHLEVTLERFQKSAEFRKALMIVNQDRPFVKKLLNQFKLFTDNDNGGDNENTDRM